MTLPSVPPRAAAPEAAPTAFEVDGERSSVRFTVRFMGMSTVAGHFSAVGGTIVECADPARCTAEIHVPVATLRTANRLRDRHLRSRHYFDARRFPEIVFRLDGLRAVEGRITATGLLTVRDTSRQIEAEVVRARPRIASPDRDSRVRYRCTFSLDRAAFGVRGSGVLGLADGVIGRTVTCHVDLEGAPVLAGVADRGSG